MRRHFGLCASSIAEHAYRNQIYMIWYSWSVWFNTMAVNVKDVRSDVSSKNAVNEISYSFLSLALGLVP